jgi:hypothetical protein
VRQRQQRLRLDLDAEAALRFRRMVQPCQQGK